MGCPKTIQDVVELNRVNITLFWHRNHNCHSHLQMHQPFHHTTVFFSFYIARTVLASGQGVEMAPKIPPRMRGQIEYFTSPYEQKLFSDLPDTKLMMTKMRRKLGFVKDMAPGLIMFASVYTWGNATHERLSHENRY